MNRSRAPTVCLALCWVPLISSPQLSTEPPAWPRLLKARPGRHTGWGWELMESGGRAGEVDLLLLILGWPRADEVNRPSTKANLQAGSWSVHPSPGHLLLSGEQGL